MPVLSGPDPRRTPPTFCNLDAWCGANANFIAIWGSGPTNIWIAAEHTGDIAGGTATVDPDNRSALLHWDGSAWNAVQFANGHAVRSIWGSSKDDVWAVGDDAIFRHFDGKGWTPVQLPVAASISFTSVSGSSSNDVWAVGSGKTVLHFDGATWSPVDVPTWDTFRSVWSSAEEVWILGDKTLNYFDRSSWSTATRPSEVVTSSVWGRTHQEAWVAGPAGTLERWNTMAEQTNDVAGRIPAANFRSLWGSSKNDGWAVGEKGLIAHWDGTAWSPGPHLTDSYLNAAWGSEGSTWFVGDNGAFLEFDGRNWLASPISSHKLNSLWGSSASDVWAVGREMVHWDGSLWQDVARPGSDEALAAWGSSATDIWAVGVHGLLLHWDGATWNASGSPTSADIKGVWGSARDDVWAVDANGRFLHFEGFVWGTWPAPSFGPLESVWGNNASDVIAVGGSNRVRFDGHEWSLLPPHPNETPVYRIAFGNGQRVWIGGHVQWHAYKAGGAYPELGRWDGAIFSDNLEPKSAPSAITLSSSSVEAGWADGERDVWIYLSRVMHWDGEQWAYSTVAGPIAAFWGSSSELWAVTRYGQILRKSR